mgnify:CR=1 FL=1
MKKGPHTFVKGEREKKSLQIFTLWECVRGTPFKLLNIPYFDCFFFLQGTPWLHVSDIAYFGRENDKKREQKVNNNT